MDDRQDGEVRALAGSNRKGVNLAKRSFRLRQYFYIDGNLYRTMMTDRPTDLLRAWSFADEKVVDFSLSSVKQNSQQAYDTKEVAVLLNRSKNTLFQYLSKGAIPSPYKIGVQIIDGQEMFGHLKWSEDDVMAMHDYLLSEVGFGRKRGDGIVKSAKNIPSRMEVMAMMRQHRRYYVQDENGNFIPVFEQPDWS